jgi:hypothetical protein
VPRFLFSHLVPKDYRPGRETGQAWEAWFESLGSSRSDTGYAVVATRTPGNLDAQTRLGGSSVVTAEDIEAAAALAGGSPALQLSWRVGIGAIPQISGIPGSGTDA